MQVRKAHRKNQNSLIKELHDQLNFVINFHENNEKPFSFGIPLAVLYDKFGNEIQLQIVVQVDRSRFFEPDSIMTINSVDEPTSDAPTTPGY